MPADYKQGKVYIISCNDEPNHFYIGSTCGKLQYRMDVHRCYAEREPHRKLYKAFTEYGMKHFTIKLLENYPCNNREELQEREQYWIDNLEPKLNERNACGQKQLNIIQCYCGGSYQRRGHSQHLKTKVHIKHDESLNALDKIIDEVLKEECNKNINNNENIITEEEESNDSIFEL